MVPLLTQFKYKPKASMPIALFIQFGAKFVRREPCQDSKLVDYELEQLDR